MQPARSGPPVGPGGPVSAPVGPLAYGQFTTALSEMATGDVEPTWPPTTGLHAALLPPPGPPEA